MMFGDLRATSHALKRAASKAMVRGRQPSLRQAIYPKECPLRHIECLKELGAGDRENERRSVTELVYVGASRKPQRHLEKREL